MGQAALKLPPGAQLVEDSPPTNLPPGASLVTEESEHARQLKPAISHPALPSALDRLLAPSDMTGNDPNTVKGYLRTWGESLKGAGSGIRKFVIAPAPGMEGNPVIWDPAEQFSRDWKGLKDWYAEAKKNPNYAVGEMVGPALLTHTVSRLLTPAGMASKLTRGTGAMAEDIEPTVDDLRAVTHEVNPKTGTKFGKPDTIGDFAEQSGFAEDTLNKEYANALGPHANDPGPITPDGKFPVAEAIYKLKLKIGTTTPQDKAARAYIDSMASNFEKPLSLDELNRQRIAANGRLYSFENKSDVAQYATAGANSGTAVDRAIANTVRDVVYPEMDRLTGKPSGYFRDLQQRVGNLFRMQSDVKEFAKRLHQETMIGRGSTPLERLHPGAAVSAHGGVHGYVANIPRAIKAPNPEAGANAAIRSAYGWRQRIQPPPEIMSLPLSSLLGVMKRIEDQEDTAPKGPKTRRLEELRNGSASPTQ